MAAHQCPSCSLRFSFRTELDYHLREDHVPTVGVDHVSAPVMVGASSLDAVVPPPRAMAPAASRAGPAGLTWSATAPSGPESTRAGPAAPAPGRTAAERPPNRIGLMPRWVLLTVIGVLVAGLAVGMFGG